MNVKLIEKERTIEKKNRLDEFPENVWGIIRKWGDLDGYVGSIVKRIGKDSLFSMEDYLNSRYATWSEFDELKSLEGDFYIEVLPEGSKIEIIL